MLTAILLMDLHWGAINPQRMMAELKESLYKKIISLENSANKLDMIVIGGDLFDFKQYLSAEVTQYVFRFLDDLLEMTSETVVYIIKGTRTHDDLQLDTIKDIYSRHKHGDRLIVINTVTEMNIKDNKVLFIPEEYIVDQREYYKDTLYNEKKYYGLIFGHGIIDKIWYAKESKQKKYSASPVFPIDEITERANYLYFGHIHEHRRYGKRKNFWYVGPFTRWEFGKESDVGFMYIEYDGVNCMEEFIVNEMAQILSTVAMNVSEEISIEEMNKKIDDKISHMMTYSDKLRLIINIDSKLPNALALKDFIITKIGNMNFIKLIISTEIKKDDMEEYQKLVEERNEKREYLYQEHNVELENRIKSFLKRKKNLDVSLEDIKSILYANSKER